MSDALPAVDADLVVTAAPPRPEPSPAARRVREHRRRMRQGRCVVRLEIPETLVIGALIASGRLTAEEALDTAALRRALERILIEAIRDNIVTRLRTQRTLT